jgi:two-component system, chemotaxis family, chemotaxis protein CheY
MVKILSADDSAFMRKLLIKSLNKIGYNDIIEVENGKDAVARFKSDKPDLVLLDIVMKEEYGTEALKEIMALDPGAKVIMVSSVGQEKVVQEAMSSGAKAFIAKPFKEPELEAKIKEILGGGAAPPAPPTQPVQTT